MTTEQILLTQLMEECNEVAQRCSKAIRFGMQEKQTKDEETNAQRIVNKLNDLLAVANNVFTGDGNETLYTSIDEDLFHVKQEEIEKNLDFSEILGILESQGDAGHE